MKKSLRSILGPAEYKKNFKKFAQTVLQALCYKQCDTRTLYYVCVKKKIKKILYLDGA